jgi:hypothetical protein
MTANPVAGISGHGRLPAAIPVRDVRGMKYESGT